MIGNILVQLLKHKNKPKKNSELCKMSRQRRESTVSNLGRKFETVREAAEGLLVLSQQAMGRVEHRQSSSPYESSDIGHTLEQRTAKKISVVIYLLSVTILGILVAFYYALVWRPPTARLFNWTSSDATEEP